MNYDAGAPEWPNRDRFVLSCGHASMLLYSFLFLTGFGLTLDDIEQFRQWESKTPGHPEYRHTPGVEVTTGPLGQGVANAVGMAVAERWLRTHFGETVSDHRIYAICSDGDFEEGISHEAGSLAGHLGLGRLNVVYDDNHITIDGPTELAYTDNVPERFRAYGWHVLELGEAAENLDALEAGLRAAADEEHKPSLVVLRSHIGYPSPNFTDSEKAHGSPLGADEVARVKEILDMPAEHFWVPDDVLGYYRAAGARGAKVRVEQERRVAEWRGSDAARAAAIRRVSRGHRRRGLGVEAAVVGAGCVGRHSFRVCLDTRRDHRRRAGPGRRRRRSHRQHRRGARGHHGDRTVRFQRPPAPFRHP